MELPERLKELRLEKNCTQKQIADQLNVTYQHYQRWEKGYRNPKKSNLEKLAKVFQVPVSYLLGETDVRSFSKLEQLLEKLPEVHQQNILDYAKSVLDEYEKSIKLERLYAYDVLNQLPLARQELPQNAHIGHTLVYWDKQVKYDLAMWIKGDSMFPTYASEEVALIKKQSLVEYDGQVCAVNYDGNTYIKKVYPKAAGLQMVSINKNHHDFFLSWTEKPQIVGKVIDSFTPIEKN